MAAANSALAPVPAAVRLIEPLPSVVLRAEMDLLRFTTAGNVDDGKSTLIGRLLYDTKTIFEDQLRALEAASRRRGDDGLNLALLTDGLRAEREQNITIDVAYRYFATPRRKFIIADTPGHAQYTRNMVTGASTADLALILVDAQRGIQTQSRRHAFISSLLGIPHFLIAVNKMDLVGFREESYRAIVDEFTPFLAKLEVKDVVFIPVSALRGDNVVERSPGMPWYEGPTLLHHLETVNIAVDRNLLDFRLPVQCVIRPDPSFRGYAGRVASGVVRTGDEVVVLPSGRASRVSEVLGVNGAVEEAAAGESVVLAIEDDVDVSRGDMIVRRGNMPLIGVRFDAMLCWMAEAALDPATRYVLMLNNRTTLAFVDRVEYRLDVDSLHRQAADVLLWNEIGRARIHTAQPVCFDPYGRNPDTGSFILVDPFTNATVAAGMIRGETREVAPAANAPRSAISPGVVWEPGGLSRADHELRNGHRAAVVWFTGLSGSGKTTLARALERRLFAAGCRTALLDGDTLRHGFCGDLGFSPADRMENIRRAGEVARLFSEQGSIVLCAFVSPFRADRDRVRELIGAERFLEVHVACDLEELRRRDTKGLYAASAAGALTNLTGLGQPYESPTAPALVLSTGEGVPVAELVERLVALLVMRGIAPREWNRHE